MNNYIVFDAHCDTVSEILKTGEGLYDNDRHLSISRMKNYRGYIQFFAAWIDEKLDNSLSVALSIIDKFYDELEKNKDSIMLVTDYSGIEAALRSGRTGALLSVEDARALCGKLSNLRMLYKLGVRAMTLAWNGNNDVTDGIASAEGKGLTAFGREVVAEMNRLSMIIDVSHITPRGFWDVMELTKKPIMASHSNAKSVCPHRRNLTDEQILAIIANGGMIGINIYPLFLNNTQKADIFDCISHIEHILSLGGEKNIGLGTDFDGVDCLPEGIENVCGLYHLFDEMIKKGYKNELIEDISHQNFVNFIKNSL